jgi:uncharacterized membrane protein required for colicin V production
MYIVLFSVIGAMRGWAKELLVAFSVILSIFIITVLKAYTGFVQAFIDAGGKETEFWLHTILILLLAFFGYQTPKLSRLATAARREKLQDSLLGFFIGAFNGYLIVGSIWHYLKEADYFLEFVNSPETVSQLLDYLPPTWLGIPEVYFAVAIAFTFVVIVFI